MGTLLQQAAFTPADYGGPALEGCNESLVRTRPDAVVGVHRVYLEPGARQRFGLPPPRLRVFQRGIRLPFGARI